MKRNDMNRIRVTESDGMIIAAAPFGTGEVTTLIATFTGGDATDESRELLKAVSSVMLEGTKTKTKHEIREFLERTGTELSVVPGTLRSTLVLRAPSRKLKFAVSLAREMLTLPAVPGKEVRLYTQQRLAEISRLQSDTRDRAFRAFDQYWYLPEHVHYPETLKEKTAFLHSLTPRMIRSAVKGWCTKAGMLVALAGDTRAEEYVRAEFAGLPKEHPRALLRSEGSRTRTRDEIFEFVPDKANVDVVIGHPVAVTSKDPDYYPLILGLAVLGDGFTSRLNHEIREMRGLTYHVRASLRNAGANTAGQFVMYSFFSPQNSDEGIRLMITEAEKWAERGVTEDELRLKKEDVVGTYALSLGSTLGFAGEMMGVLERGWPLSSMETFRERIESISREEVNTALRKHIHPEHLLTVRAGTIGK